MAELVGAARAWNVVKRREAVRLLRDVRTDLFDLINSMENPVSAVARENRAPRAGSKKKKRRARMPAARGP